MRGSLLVSLGVAVGFAGAVNAQTEFPFFDDFEAGEPAPNWEQDSTSNPSWDEAGTFDAVQDDFDWLMNTVEPPDGGGDWIGRLLNEDGGTARRVVGTYDATDYTVDVDIFVQNVNDPEQPDSYHYQIVMLAVHEGTEYTRLHFHHNLDEEVEDPRIRIQTQYDGWEAIFESPTADILGHHDTGWYNVRVDVNNSDMTMQVWLNGVDVNDGPITVNQDGYAEGGKAGIGNFGWGDHDDGLGPRQLYVDNFFAGDPDEVSVGDWAVYE